MNKKIKLCVVMFSIMLPGLIGANEKMINLKKASEQAAKLNVPIMLVFMDDDCEDCESIKDEVLKPMQISGDYQDKIVVITINIQNDKIIDFTGAVNKIETLTNRYDLELTPSVSFVDAVGKTLIPPISGLSNLEYYGSLVDEGIEKANIKLQNNKN